MTAALTREQIESWRASFPEEYSTQHLDELNALCDMALASLLPAVAQFKPTHRHSEGGLYQIIGSFVKVKTGKDSWVIGVRYRNAEGMEFVRTLDEFDQRMSPL